MDQKTRDMVRLEIDKIFDNHKEEVDNSEFDSILEELFVTGGKHYVELALDILKDANVKVTNPLYQVIDGKLYKRVEK